MAAEQRAIVPAGQEAVAFPGRIAASQHCPVIGFRWRCDWRPVCLSAEQFKAYPAITCDRLGPVFQVGERGVRIDAEQVEGRGQDILGRHG